MVTLAVLVEVVVVDKISVKYSSFEAHPLLLDLRRQREVAEVAKAPDKPKTSRHTCCAIRKTKRKGKVKNI